MNLRALFTGDWDNESHGPAHAPPATAADVAQYARNGYRCVCSACNRGYPNGGYWGGMPPHWIPGGH